MNLQNKVVVITGASQGLGKELALQTAKLGAKVALVARTEKLLQELKTQIEAEGGVAEYFVCDITKVEQINSTVPKIIDIFKTIDILINNAGIWTKDSLEEKDADLVEKAFMINSVAPINFYKAVAPIFEKNNSGHFVFINSVAGLEKPDNKYYAVYAATKWALTGFTNALKNKYFKSLIKVTSIHPGSFVSSIDKNAGDDWGPDYSWRMKTTEVAQAVVYALTAPDRMQLGQIELEYTNSDN